MPRKNILTSIISLAVCGLGFFVFSAEAQAAPSIISPTPGSTLTGSSQAFTWNTNGTAVTAWYLWAGPCSDATLGGCGDDYYGSSELSGTTSTKTATGLPTDGSKIYVRLWYEVGENWNSALFIYNLFSAPGCSNGICYVDNSASALNSCSEGDSNYNPSTRICSSGGTFEYYSKIQNAIDDALAGDKIIVHTGTYEGAINIIKNNITLQGTKVNGEWLSAIDGSVSNVDGWERITTAVDATFKSNNVHRKKLGFSPAAMIIAGDKSVLRIDPNVMPETCYLAWDPEGWCGMDILKSSSDRPYVTTKGAEWGTFRYWDGIETMFGYSSNGYTYVRFEDGGDPATHGLKISSNNAVVNIQNISKTAISDLKIMGGLYGVHIHGENAKENIIENSYIIGGNNRVLIEGGASSNIVRDNLLKNNYYSSNPTDAVPQPWESSYQEISAYTDTEKRKMFLGENFYSKFKTLAGASTEARGDTGVNLEGAGAYNEIVGNTITHGAVGVNIEFTDHTSIYENTISNMSCEDIMHARGATNSRIYDNDFSLTNILIRVQGINKDHRSAKIFRNKFYNPPNIGTHFYFHLYGPGDSNPTTDMYIYHNSFAGADKVFGASSGSDGGIWEEKYSEILSINAVNNIFSSRNLYLNNIQSTHFDTFSYNWIGGIFTHKNWMTNNLEHPNLNMWDAASLPDFNIPVSGVGSDAKEAGYDITAAPYGAANYPGFSADYFNPQSRPNMGAVQSGDITGNPADVNSDTYVNIKDIQACIKVITRSNMTYEDRCSVLAPPTDRTNIKDIQVIIRAIINPS